MTITKLIPTSNFVRKGCLEALDQWASSDKIPLAARTLYDTTFGGDESTRDMFARGLPIKNVLNMFVKCCQMAALSEVVDKVLPSLAEKMGKTVVPFQIINILNQRVRDHTRELAEGGQAKISSTIAIRVEVSCTALHKCVALTCSWSIPVSRTRVYCTVSAARYMSCSPIGLSKWIIVRCSALFGAD